MLLRSTSSLLVLLAATVAFADEPDDEGCKDHPNVPRFPGFRIERCNVNDFSAQDFVVSEEKVESKEGRFWELRYELQPGAKRPSPLELARNYENAVKKGGGARVYFNSWDHSGGTGTLRMPVGKTERWIEIDVANEGSAYALRIVEVAAMRQTLELTAGEMLDALNKQGFLALYGILFDTGKDTIKSESTPLLDEIATLLANNPALRLSAEGHTDNVGDAKTNQTLSLKRAEAVKRYLVAKAVDAKRLEAKGWGDTNPVADNRGEEGRAKNRRVELVKK